MFCYDLQGLSLMRIDINCSVFFFFFSAFDEKDLQKPVHFIFPWD